MWRALRGRVLLLVGVGLPFPSPTRRGKGRRRREKERGALPPFPSPIRTRGGGRAALPWPALSLSTKAHVAHLVPPGFLIPPRHSDNYPVTPETLPVSEYHHPIYQSLPLDHFETPRHVRDLIRYSEQHSVSKSHNTKSSLNVKRADPTGSRTM